jgi:hypothetical protein
MYKEKAVLIVERWSGNGGGGKGWIILVPLRKATI